MASLSMYADGKHARAFESKTCRSKAGRRVRTALREAALFLSNAPHIDARTLFDGFDHLDLIDRQWIDRHRILIEDNQVGKLAGFDRALAAFFEVLVRRPNCLGFQGDQRRDAMLGPEYLTGPGDTVDRGVKDAHGIGLGDRGVVVRGEHHPTLHRPTGR